MEINAEVNKVFGTEMAKLFAATISEEELKQLDELYQYVLDDDQTYPTINRNIIKDEIPVLVKVLTWMDDEGIGSFEHTDMLEKMTAK